MASCNSGQMKFESIEKVIQIIEDKYSYRFLDLLRITFEVLPPIYRLENNSDKIDLIEKFFGTSGTNLTISYIQWSNEFYSKDLIPAIQALLGNLHYS